MKSIFALTLTAALATVGMASTASAAVIFADDFESDARGTPSVLNKWDVISGSIDVIGPNAFNWYGPGNYVDLNGTPTGPASIQTKSEFSIVAGQTYKLSFDYGNNKNSNNVEQLTYALGSFGGSIDIPGAIPGLISVNKLFVASTTGNFKLSFADTGPTPNDVGGPILDNVVLSAVPLPAGGLLLIGALGGVAALRRRKKA